MNSKTIVIGVIAFAIGGVSGYFFAKNQLQEQYRKDTAEVRDYYRKKGIEEDPEEESKLPAFEVKTSILDQSEYKRIITNYSNPPLESLGYGRQGEPPDDEEFYKDGDDDVVEAEAQWYEDAENAEEPDPEPYLIDIGEYQHDEKWDKEEVFLYRTDDTYCTYDDDVIDDPLTQFGPEALEAIQSHVVVYVRNENFGTDYAIHALNESYDLTIGSRLETPTEKRFRQNARAKMFMDLIESGGEINVDEAFPDSYYTESDD